MDKWEKLNKEFDNKLNSMTSEDWENVEMNSMTSEDWDNWYENVEMKRINQNKMTAVKWFAQELYEKFEMKGDGKVFDELLELAELMEKKQHQETWENAHQAGRFEGKGIAEDNWQTWETYCAENFNYEK